MAYVIRLDSEVAWFRLRRACRPCFVVVPRVDLVGKSKVTKTAVACLGDSQTI